MKKKVLFVLFIIGIAVIASAQGWGPGANRPRIPPAETVTVSGSMILAHGMPALKSGDVTYIVGGISRLAGFIEGLKEGAQVTIEGSAMTNPRNGNVKFLMPTKLSLGGRSYDLAPAEMNTDSPRPGFWQQPPSPRQPAVPRQPNARPNHHQGKQHRH